MSIEINSLHRYLNSTYILLYLLYGRVCYKMIPQRRRSATTVVRRLRLLAAVIFLLTAAVSLYARGAREDSILSKADELIAEKEYDEAVQVLSDYMKDNPDRFGEAQKRLQKIIKLRERYSELANELLDVVEERPDDSDTILKLSDELLAIESPSNPATRRFLEQIRYLAEFRVNSRRLERILVAARAQLNQNDYPGALATYASGLDIYQDLYFSSGYGEEAENVASRGLENIEKNIMGFNALENPINRSAVLFEQLADAYPPSPAEVAGIITEISPFLDQITAICESFRQINKSFYTQLAINQIEHNETGDRSFLSFAGMLLAGPPRMREGMIGTLEQFWNFRIGSAESALTDLVNRYYNSGLDAMVNRNYSGGIPIFDTTDLYIAAGMELTGKSSVFLESEEKRDYVIYGETVSEERARNYLTFQVMSNAIDYIKIAANLANQDLTLERAGFPALASWQRGAMTAQAAISQEQVTRQAYQSLINELATLNEKIDEELDSFGTYEAALSNMLGGIGTPQKPLNDASELTASLNARFRTMEYNSALRRYTIATGDLEQRVREREAEFNEGNAFIAGIIRQTDWGESYTAYYPGEGLALLTRMNENLEPDIRDARALVAQFGAEDQNVLDAAEMSRLYALSRNLLSRLLSLQSGSAGIMPPASEQVQRAASLRFEGDRLFQAARTALNRDDFDGARNNLTRATEQYRASRAIQESDSLRITWDTQVVGLNDEIDRKQNEVIVQYVRNQVTAARNFYFEGNIDQAERALINAQNRWRITNTTEHPDVEYWLGLVRGAMSLQSNRTIAPTAPLYAEMSQLLSEARRNYNEGVVLLNAGQRQEGLTRFSDAMDKTREVRLMFPLNHDAMMLELRIEQQTNLPIFNASFQQRMNQAIAGTKTRNLQSYADLQDLAEINPQYPNLRTILNQAEIDMGYRPPPPNQADLARSTELTRSAEAIVNSRDTTRYPLARTQLENAIRLNPNNTQAQRLLDIVLIQTTGTGTIAIPRDVQDQYDVAYRFYTQGNYLQADAILQRLLQNPANQRYNIILELKRRNDAFL